MSTKMRIFAACFLLLTGLTEFSATAQENYSYYYFPVTRILRPADSSTYLSINQGSGYGIRQHQEVSVWGQYIDDNQQHSDHQLAAGVVDSVGADFAIIRVAETDTIFNRDLVAVYLPEPDMDPELLGLIRLRIDFIDLDGASFIDLDNFFAAPSPAEAQKIIAHMLADIRELAIKVRPDIADVTIDGGLFAGRTMLDMMAAVNERQLRSHLRYIIRYPLKYMGKSSSLAESYAVWLINNSSLTDADLLAYFKEAARAGTLADFVTTFGNYLQQESQLINWGEDILQLAHQGDTTWATALTQQMVEMAAMLQNSSFSGWAIYYQARVAEYVLSPEEVIALYQQSIGYFNAAGNYHGPGLAYIDMADQYDGLGAYDLVVQAMATGQTFLEKYCQANPNAYYEHKEWARSQYLLGYAHMQMAHYDSAITYFNRMWQQYKSLDDRQGVSVAMENLAEAYARNGNCDQANAVSRQRIDTYQSWGDDTRLADAYFDVAYLLNKWCNRYQEAIAYYELSYTAHLAIADTVNAIISRSNVGQSYWSLKELNKAIDNHRQAVALAIKANNPQQHIFSLTKLADLYKENGNPRQGLAAYDEIIALLKKTGDTAQLIDMYNKVGDIYTEANDRQLAAAYYQRAIDAAAELADPVRLADSYFGMGNLLFSESKFAEAGNNYLKSVTIATEADYQGRVVYGLSNLGLVYSLQDEYEQADSIFALALTMAEEINDKSNIAFTTYRLAETAVRKREYGEAHNLYARAIKLYTELGDQRFQSIVLQSLTSLLMNEGKFAEAEATILQAREIATENNDRTNMASCLFYLSDMYARIFGNFDKAWEYQLQANELYEEIDNTWGMAVAYLNMGNIYNLQGEYSDAINYYQKSDSLYRVLQSEYSRATPINNIGTIYYWQGDYEKALPKFFAALEILDKLGVKDASRTLYVSNIGEVYSEQGKYELADKWLQQALTEAREINDLGQLNSTLTILGEMKIGQQQYDLAARYLQEAYQIGREKNIMISLPIVQLNLGKLYYLTGETGQAHKYLAEAVSTSLAIGTDRRLWEAYYYQGLMAKEAGRLQESKEALINAIETLERIQSKIVGGAEARKIFASGEKQVMVYSTLVDVLIELGEVDLALQYLERSNVEALRNKFNQLNIRFQDEAANETLKKERELKKKLDNLEQTLANEKAAAAGAAVDKIATLEKSRSIAENEYLKFVNQTINTNPELARHFSGGFHPRKLKTDKNRKLIPPELIVLSYLPADEKLYIFAATADTVIAKVVNVGLPELDKNIKYIYNFTSRHVKGLNTDALRVARGDNEEPLPADFNKSESNYKRIAEQLYNWLIAPVKAEMDLKGLVAVIATGVLHFLPFRLLGQTVPNGKFDYLIEHYTLFYSHTLEMLYQQNSGPEEISILAFGNADNTLPATEEEVKDLQAIYPHTEVLLRDQATEDRVKKFTGNHNVLHFATHGNLDYYDYNKSYLTLAPNAADGEDGKLTIEEVWEIEDIYSYQLVTLSACSTALANDYSTGWAVSPASSFIDAGTSTVVASLWAVNDASTALLMKYFYENMKTMDKVEALRQAQIKLSNLPDYRHPYYWAPFILIGNWQ